MTLTQTAILTKQVITFGVIFLVVTVTGFTGYKMWDAYQKAQMPPVEEKPDTKFGVLPIPNFPKSVVSSSNFSYTLDTTTGSLPKIGVDSGFDKIIRVYFVIKPYATFLSPQRSQELAAKFNLTSPPQALTDTSYLFSQGNKKLTVDLDSGNFSYIKDSTPSASEKLDDDNSLLGGFENILSTVGIFKKELEEGRTKITLLKIDGGKLVQTQLRSEATGALVSIWPKPLDKKSIFTGDFNKALINASVINSSSNLENYSSLNFTFWPIDLSIFATYSTKSPDDAFNDLKVGKGVVILEPKKPQVSITSVYLGYYLSEDYSPYLQPIYIFEGSDFAAYVGAITEQFQNLAK